LRNGAGSGNCFSLHNSAADRAHRGHCAADHQLGRRGHLAVTIVTFIICLAPIIANTTQGLISVDENLIHLFLMYKATPAQILFKLRLPNALPNLFTGIRISAGISVIGGIDRRTYLPAPRAWAKADWAMRSFMPTTRWRPLSVCAGLCRHRAWISASFSS
jgi:hypothetical protein